MTRIVLFIPVGTAVVFYFVRPLLLQPYLNELLSHALQDSNPLSIWRLVSG